MSSHNVAVIVLAAGQGTRMKSSLPKVLHPLAGRPMISHLLASVETLAPEKIVVVVGPGQEAVTRAVAPHATVLQEDRLGTGHAALQARPLLDGFDGTVLILFGDTPLLDPETLRRMVARREADPRPAVVVLGFRPVDGAEYGRLVVGEDGLQAIVEFKDATAEQRGLPLCNSGAMAVDGARLFAMLASLSNTNAKGEYYLTDIVAKVRGQGLRCDVVEGRETELLGVNSRQELAGAEAVVQARLREAAMAGGATLQDPATVYFSWDTVLGRDVTIGPNVYFGPEVSIGDNVLIRAFCHLAGVTVAQGAEIGPFARLRPGAEIGEGVHVGNFVEIKKAKVEAGAKVNHLTYIGDARIGAGANIGAGTITCNYDGFSKSFTDIGRGAFIGSNSSLVAPVVIGDGAIVGAGSVVTKDVGADALAVERSDQREVADWAGRFRRTRAAIKAGTGKE